MQPNFQMCYRFIFNKILIIYDLILLNGVYMVTKLCRKIVIHLHVRLMVELTYDVTKYSVRPWFLFRPFSVVVIVISKTCRQYFN